MTRTAKILHMTEPRATSGRENGALRSVGRQLDAKILPFQVGLNDPHHVKGQTKKWLSVVAIVVPIALSVLAGWPFSSRGKNDDASPIFTSTVFNTDLPFGYAP